MNLEATGPGPVARTAIAGMHWRRWAGIGEPLLVAALFVALIVATLTLSVDPYREYDEGFNLMKAALLAKGFSLYSDIWSDQPPVFTFILATVQWLFGENLIASRITVLAFAAWLAASLFRIVRRAEGRAAAWIAMIALVGATKIAHSSVTVMIGLPALAFAIAGLDQALAGADRGARWRFVLAGLLFGVALQTKMFVAILLPALAIAPFASQTISGSNIHRSGLDLAVMLATASAVIAAIALLTGEPVLQQLIIPHLQASDLESYARAGGIDHIVERIRPAFLLLGVGLGLIAFALRPSLLRAIPVVWLLAAVTLLTFHRPIWLHHLTVIVIPMAWLTGMAVTLGERLPWRRAAALGFAALALFFSGSELLRIKKAMKPWITAQERPSLAASNGGSDRWLVTDRPMDAYIAGRLVPPELAVFSEKRTRSGNLTADQLVDATRKRQPAEVLLVRFRPDPAVLEYLDRNYERTPPHAQGRRPVFRYVERTSDITASIGAKGEAIADALEIVAGDLASRAIGGGYAGHYNVTTGKHFSRNPHGRSLAADQIVVRPPGSTQLVGQCFLRAHQMTGRPKFQEYAVAAGHALACTQRAAGGWREEPYLRKSCEAEGSAEESERRDGILTIDEGATPKAIDFLMDLESHLLARTTPLPVWLAPAIRKSLGTLLAIQDKGGGWPQRYPPPGGSNSYARHFTFNDGAMTAAIATTLNAHRHYRDPKYLKAAVLAGEFILRTQGPPPQAGWAQQYDAEFRPAPARPFEPAAYSSHESGHVMNALLDIYLATGDARFLAPLQPARAWLDRSEIRPGVWARLYEPESNRPLYGDRNGIARYNIDEVSEERRYGYDWEMRFPTVVRALARHDAALAGGAEGLRKFDAGRRPLSADEKATVARLLGEAKEKRRWSKDEIIVTQAFVDNCNLLLRAIEAPH